MSCARSHFHCGLSPRVRGNRLPPGRRGRCGGSIPARAGEPPAISPSAAPSAVYPRACGGTHVARLIEELHLGLSPRVRGNLIMNPIRPQPAGSIPARAGEPRHLTLPRGCGGVYPRACGGTFYCRPARVACRGLSPRVRGNPRFRPFLPDCIRSIPARAGEPWSGASCSSMIEVYPRACGGTAAEKVTLMTKDGLSPRVRGNRQRRGCRPSPRRSIPARAGEPSSSAASTAAWAVYPRACGGTSHLISEKVE